MFRKPRENAGLDSAASALPSTGRPPTPPAVVHEAKSEPSTSLGLLATSARKKPLMAKNSVLGRQPPPKSPAPKRLATANRSILNFFGKADKEEAHAATGAGLFFKDTSRRPLAPVTPPGATAPDGSEEPPSRYNEHSGSIKKRRTGDGDDAFLVRTPSPERQEAVACPHPLEEAPPPLRHAKPKKQRGGFLDDSSDDEDGDGEWTTVFTHAANQQPGASAATMDAPPTQAATDVDGASEEPTAGPSPGFALYGQHTPDRHDLGEHDRHDRTNDRSAFIPSPGRQDTSVYQADDFDQYGDWEQDEFDEAGEEYMERRWMEEQREMVHGLDDDSKSDSDGDSIRTPRHDVDNGPHVDIDDLPGDALTLCPICNGSLKGLSEERASSHVNACLDGNAEPLPDESTSRPLTLPSKPETPSGPSALRHASMGPEGPVPRRFQRAAIARPAQSNPFGGEGDKRTSSAFTRLMSGHAEDAAWAAAAASEVQARGKPAYQRTCPFYKIMPGLSICVDAFRYGKVEGQSAYFLSHFHSDHYVGLTASWCHGPIYASKVTCNLMLQQLRVDPKWVVPLEFEKKTEVPDTKGVWVTMIPANHCPGSSLYLFEKVVGKHRDGSPRSTRILHCGDFRACPAHVSHPLLRPDVVDAVTGQTQHQVIDTCYLDTTYLTPKYAFPSQHDVIDACAQMCVSLAREIVDGNDGWETAKAGRAGSAMKKFLAHGEPPAADPAAGGDADDQKAQRRGRLLVVIGTYSIGKERICLGIAKALGSKIYAPPAKMRICRCLEDAELDARLTADPLEAQVHMQTLMEIRAETLHDYMMSYKGYFARVVGFRPTGWSYRPPTSRFTDNPAVQAVLHSDGWKTRYTMRDLAPQRGSTREANCFGVPYSEHSSFRELTMFCCALRINRVVPTVNVGSARTREKMKAWFEKWEAEKRKHGLYQVEARPEGWGSGDGQLRYGV